MVLKDQGEPGPAAGHVGLRHHKTKRIEEDAGCERRCWARLQVVRRGKGLQPEKHLRLCAWEGSAGPRRRNGWNIGAWQREAAQKSSRRPQREAGRRSQRIRSVKSRGISPKWPWCPSALPLPSTYTQTVTLNIRPQGTLGLNQERVKQEVRQACPPPVTWGAAWTTEGLAPLSAGSLGE